MRRVLLLCLVALFAVACETAPQVPVIQPWTMDGPADDGPVASTPQGLSELPERVDGRLCRGDMLAADVPVSASVPAGLTLSLHTQVAHDLEASAQRHASTWFCAAGDPCMFPGTSNNDVRVVMEPVFEELPGTPWGTGWRGEGPVRHVRHSFRYTPGGGAGQPLEVVPDAQCDAVSRLRYLYEEALGVLLPFDQQPDLYVGRECDAMAQASTAWHRERLGLTTSSAPAGAGVVVALVDTLIDAGSAWLPYSAYVHPNAQGGGSTHALAMGHLVRETASRAELRYYGGLTQGWGGPLAGVATAIDIAVRDIDRAFVLNLSLGWPPEMGIVHHLAGPLATFRRDGSGGVIEAPSGSTLSGSCQTAEPPAGEAVRFALTLARDVGAVPIAAAGNRTESVFLPIVAWRDRCEESRDNERFYPAEWSRQGTCRPGNDRIELLTLAVGQYAERPLEEFAAPDAPLIAPGHLVPVDDLSRTYSGTSVSAALTSGVAAGVWELMRANGAPEPTPREMRRLLWYAGAPSGCAETRFTTVAYSSAAAACVADGFPSILDSPPISGDGVNVGSGGFGSCGAFPALGGPSICTVVPSSAWSWSSPPAAPLAHSIDLGGQSAQPVGDPDEPDAYSAGTVGPQPLDPICPSGCHLVIFDPAMYYDDTVYAAYIQLPSNLPKVESLRLIFEGKDAKQKVTVPVAPDDPNGVELGKPYKVTGIKTPAFETLADWSAVNVTVEATFSQESKYKVRRSDPLPIYLK